MQVDLRIAEDGTWSYTVTEDGRLLRHRGGFPDKDAAERAGAAWAIKVATARAADDAVREHLNLEDERWPRKK